MARLTVKNLRKEFDGGDILAVNDLNLDIEDGEFIVIVGPSGCGKSTTLNCIVGLDHPTSGTISIGEEDVTNKPPQERDTAMVFQNYALYPHMNTESNIEFGLKMSTELSSEERKKKVHEIAELLQIEDQLQKRPADLSGGQRQRVALGRAIVREPAIFLMDEPLSNLDAKLRSTMRTEIQQLQNSLGITTVYVTHDQTEAMTMSDRIAILDGGELQQFGTPQEVYHEPANQFVAGFIGEPSMNFFNVSKDSVDGSLLRFASSNEPYDLTTVHDQFREASNELVLGIRPNHISLSENPDITAEIQVVEPMGEYNLVHFAFGGKTYTVKVDGAITPEENSSAGFNLDKDHIHLFDRASGEAILNPTQAKVTAKPGS